MNRGAKNLTMIQKLACVCMLVIMAASLVVIFPQTATALDVERCTARANAESGNDVMGGTTTRITWEGQASPQEELKGISFTLPEGTSYSTKNLRVTMLSGADLMDRTNIAFKETADNETLTLDFDEVLPAGAYIRIEVYDVKFPTEGGCYGFSWNVYFGRWGYLRYSGDSCYQRCGCVYP